MENQNLPQLLADQFRGDPSLWRPMTYGRIIDVAVAANSRAVSTIPLNARPYILCAISHQIVGLLDEDGIPIQDGQYLISWRDELSQYVNEAIPADLLFGSVRSGFVKPLPYPVFYSGNSTITFEVTNLITRTNPPTNIFKVSLALDGWAYWGSPSAT